MTDNHSAEKLRLFLAMSMPEAIRNEVIRLQREMQRLVSRDAVRWTKPEQFHLTLRFLGDVAVERIAALQEAINTACTGVPVLRLRAQGVGFFPNARSPRVIWVGVSDVDVRLVELQKKIEAAVQPFTQEPGTGKFACHVTLGRVKFLKQPEIEKLAAHAQTVRDRLFGEWTANEFELIRSELLPGGASHTLVAAIRLTGDG